jgi:ribulose kinase
MYWDARFASQDRHRRDRLAVRSTPLLRQKFTPDVKSAAEKMLQPDLKVYKLDQQNHKLYSNLYAEYKKLHDYFGNGGNDVMLNL